ncbi:MAG: hypothetical protein KKD18_03925 [Nanoarchaeota archaeon]|nr:hypothetical protein [Nanoarchaeota archaeon]MBU0977540.1 hypothetical protein [Nanoarchaeota archaeon]
MHKKANTPLAILLLVIGFFLVLGFAWFAFLTRSGELQLYIDSNHLLESMYAKESQINIYINSLVQISAKDAAASTEKEKAFVTRFRQELEKSKIQGKYFMPQLEYIDQQLSEDNVKIQNDILSIPFKIKIDGAIKDESYEIMSAEYIYEKEFRAELKDNTQTTEGSEIQIEIGETITFANHQITLKEISSSMATLEIRSEVITITLSVGQTTEFDLNHDGKNDIKIRLISISSENNKASFEIQEIVPGAQIITSPQVYHLFNYAEKQYILIGEEKLINNIGVYVKDNKIYDYTERIIGEINNGQLNVSGTSSDTEPILRCRLDFLNGKSLSEIEQGLTADVKCDIEGKQYLPPPNRKPFLSIFGDNAKYEYGKILYASDRPSKEAVSFSYNGPMGLGFNGGWRQQIFVNSNGTNPCANEPDYPQKFLETGENYYCRYTGLEKVEMSLFVTGAFANAPQNNPLGICCNEVCVLGGDANCCAHPKAEDSYCIDYLASNPETPYA